jgi:peptidoglycan/xylan/chitin deacetylase (PgdA/CDA1 family)
MKRVSKALLFVAFLTIGNVGYCGTVDSPYEVGTWSGFRTAAITYTFDDNLSNQLSIAIPLFNNYGFKATLYTVTSPSWVWPANWTGLQNAAAQSHEIGNHTVTHPSNWCSLTSAQQESQYASSKSTINSYIPGNQCLTVAYPYCCANYETMTATYFIAGRTCSGAIVPATPSNFYQISSFVLGSSGINTTAGIIAKHDQAASSGGWAVYLIHAVDGSEGGGYSPLSSTILDESLQYLDAHREVFWVDTFLNVVKYIKERNDVSVTETSNIGYSITLSVTDTLNNSIYDYPITIRRPLPESWEAAIVSQNGTPVFTRFVMIGSIRYVVFDAVPDGGDVMLLQQPYGDFDANGQYNLYDLSSFCNVWLEDNCTKTARYDLDGDCLVNFYEYAFLAENWLLEAS